MPSVARLPATAAASAATTATAAVAAVAVRLYTAVTNGRHPLAVALNFLRNFAPIFVWLEIFGHAKDIPVGWRPRIHPHVAFYADLLLFGDVWREAPLQGLSALLPLYSVFTAAAFALLLLLLLPLALHLRSRRRVSESGRCAGSRAAEPHDALFQRRGYRNAAVRFLPFAAFCVLNVAHLAARQSDANFAQWKDLLAWTFYVVLHVTAPIVSAVYLYVFHAPGVVMCFALCLGLQNICGVFTHLLVPMAPPWFTHLYGLADTEHVSYAQQGFAAGLARVDKHLGTHLNTNGFHKSPIVFGAVPSIHSAIAFQCFLFVFMRSAPLKGRFRNAGAAGAAAPAAPAEDFSDSVSTHSTDSCISKPEDIEMSPMDGGDGQVASESAGSSPVPGPLKSGFIQYYEFPTAVASKWYFRFLNTGLLPKIVVTVFVSVQWWATMYLDHHYRFDLFVGLLYAMASYMIINYTLLQPRVLQNFVDTRKGQGLYGHREGRTLGMRVFQGTDYEWFFDPLA